MATAHPGNLQVGGLNHIIFNLKNLDFQTFQSINTDLPGHTPSIAGQAYCSWSRRPEKRKVGLSIVFKSFMESATQDDSYDADKDVPGQI